MRWSCLLLAACTGRAVVVAPAAEPPVAESLALPPPPPPPPQAPSRVVIISEDGLRPDALDPRRTPVHMALIAAGAMAREAETIPESDTLPSHAAMLSGVGVEEHGLWWNTWKPEKGYIHVPTIFSIAHAQGLSTAMIVGKPKLKHIALPGSVDHYERPSYLCGGVAERAAAWFTQAKPDLMFVHFSDPDEYGHANGWMSRQYEKAVADSDRCLGTLLAAIDASGLAPTTLVLVTADHGGHGHAHSGGQGSKAVDRDIPWIARGPGVPAGLVIEERISTEDTAATVLAALKLPVPLYMVATKRLF